MKSQGNRLSFALGFGLLLSALPASGIRENPAFHQPRPTVAALPPSKPHAASKTPLEKDGQRNVAKITSRVEQESSNLPQRPAGLLLEPSEFDGFGSAFEDPAQVDAIQDFDHAMRSGVVSSGIDVAQTEGMRLNVTPWLSVSVDVALPLGQDRAEEISDNGWGTEFRVFSALAMRF
jgi:hypothetical protein